MSGVILELSRVARESGIEFDSITPQGASPISGYSSVPLSVEFEGNFYELSDFLFRLRNLVRVDAGRLDAKGRLFVVDSISFGESTHSFPEIKASLTVHAFVYGDVTLAAPPAETAPATTDTTSTTTQPTTTTPTPEAPPRGRQRCPGDSVMAKKFDPKAKAKRQKIIAAVLGVLLIGVMAYEVPSLMKAQEAAARRCSGPGRRNSHRRQPRDNGSARRARGGNDSYRFRSTGAGRERAAPVVRPVLEQGPVRSAGGRHGLQHRYDRFRGARVHGRSAASSGLNGQADSAEDATASTGNSDPGGSPDRSPDLGQRHERIGRPQQDVPLGRPGLPPGRADENDRQDRNRRRFSVDR